MRLVRLLVVAVLSAGVIGGYGYAWQTMGGGDVACPWHTGAN